MTARRRSRAFRGALPPVALLCALVALMMPAVREARAAPAAFADVPATYWAAGDIEDLAGQGVLQGVGGGRFDPSGEVTRAEWATMLARARRVPADTVGPPFGDVPAGAWFYSGVEAAAGLGWMSGESRGVFAPSAPLTRAMAAVTVARVLGLSHVADDESGATLPYRDAAEVPAWARGAVAVATHLGVIKGSGGDILATRPLTRAEAAAVLVRLAGVTDAQLAREGSRVAATVDVVPQSTTVDLGGALKVAAYARDAQGYIVPARLAWRAGNGSVAPASPADPTRAAAVFTAAGAGAATVTVTVAGTRVGRTAQVTVLQPASLDVGTVPPAVLSSATLPLPVRVVATSGATDIAADTMVTATARPTSGGATPVTADTTLHDGTGTLTLPRLPVGQWQLRVAAGGLPSFTAELESVAAPLGTLALSGGAAVAVGSTLEVAGTPDSGVPLPGGAWPLRVSVSGTATSLPPLVGEPPAPQPLQVRTASVDLAGAGGPVAVVVGEEPGRGDLHVAVPGGALMPADLSVTVVPAGAFGGSAEVADGAGQAVTVRVEYSGAGLPLYLEPVDPAGHPRPWVPATVRGGFAEATFTPTRAGAWTLRWQGGGAVPVAAGEVQVRPGPAVRLMVDATPTSILLPGQRALLRAWEADRYGNPVPASLALAVSRTGDAAAGTLTGGSGTFAGPATVGSFAAGAPGSVVLTFWTPGLAPVTVHFRTVSNRADRISGKGGWAVFPDWKRLGTAGLLAQAEALGLTHIYLEVATTRDGVYGERALDQVLPEAHAAGIAVIAWVYAGLEDPARDTAAVREVASYVTPTGDRVDGVALDLEEVLTPSVVAAYSAAADAAEGPRGLVVAVPYPPAYGPQAPLAVLAPNVQAIAPMDYWHVRQRDYSYSEVYTWIRQSLDVIRERAGAAMPVEVIAQAYDAFAGAGGQGIYSPSAAEIAAAMRAAADGGAVGVSFYRPATATGPEQAAIAGRWPDG